MYDEDIERNVELARLAQDSLALAAQALGMMKLTPEHTGWLIETQGVVALAELYVRRLAAARARPVQDY